MSVILGVNRFDFEQLGNERVQKDQFLDNTLPGEDLDGHRDLDSEVPNSCTEGPGGRPKFPCNLTESQTGPLGRPNVAICPQK